jgi:hypothetical protein
MAGSPGNDALLESIERLAGEIARASPESAEQARQIALLAGELRCGPPDRAAIRDAIDSETADSDISDTQIRSATEAVMRAVREAP